MTTTVVIPGKEKLTSLFRETGTMTSVGLEATRKVFSRPWPVAEFLDQLWFLAKVTTVPVILISIPFGMVISLQVGSLIRQLGAEAHLGSALVLAVREQAPIATALMIAGAGGSAMCADLGARRIRDEISAMEVMGVNPIQRLVMPRVLAATLLAVLLDAVVSAAGIAGGWFFGVRVNGVSSSSFFASFNELSQLADLWMALLKAACFGFIAGVVACYKGLYAKGGPKGVGDAVNQAVVITFVLLFFVNFVLTIIYFNFVPAEDLMANPNSILTRIDRPATAVMNPWTQIYDQLRFYVMIIRRMPKALRYRREVIALISDITIGAGALVVGGGMFFVIFSMSFFTGTEVGLQGFKGLQQIGAEAFTGVIASVANTREITPLIAGVALAAQVGAGFTAQLGAMRISDEVDALEVMGVDSVVYLVCTRVWAALITMVPLYLAALFASFLATEIVVTQFFTLSPGVYRHYFNLFLPPIDILGSFVKAMLFAVVVTLVHCFYGYYASGGPAGVGQAAGRAIRVSIIAVVVLNLILSLIFWGGSDTARIVG